MYMYVVCIAVCVCECVCCVWMCVDAIGLIGVCMCVFNQKAISHEITFLNNHTVYVLWIN